MRARENAIAVSINQCLSATHPADRLLADDQFLSDVVRAVRKRTGVDDIALPHLSTEVFVDVFDAWHDLNLTV